jgi:hypothetical protein
MRADSNCTASAIAIAAAEAGSSKIANFRPFFAIYGRVRLPKIFCLKWFLHLDPRYRCPYLGPTQVATGELIVLIRIPSHNDLSEA